ncbi:MAG: PIN domain-containing protein [Guyparkeria sp.]
MDSLIRRWLERSARDRTIPSNIDLARARSTEQFDALRRLVALGTAGNNGEIVLVPDTNALLFNPDVAVYTGAVGRVGYLVVLLPTVLSELDDLKDRGRTSDVRDQAGKVIERIKGLRDRGSLINGVKVARQVYLRAEPRETQASSVLNWLDPAVPDDRIIAAALDIQARQAGPSHAGHQPAEQGSGRRLALRRTTTALNSRRFASPETGRLLRVGYFYLRGWPASWPPCRGAQS